MAILTDFVENGLDFRRFQFPLAHDYSADGVEPKSAYDAMQALGNTLGTIF